MLAAIHAAHVVVDQLTQRFPNVSHVVVDKPLTIADSRWAIGAAFASGAAAIGSVAVAVATFVLAASTRKSVEKTKELVAGENLRFQTENTTRLMNDYLQVKIYQSPNADFSAYIATSNIINTSRHDLQVLKAQVKELPKQIADADGQAAAASIGFQGAKTWDFTRAPNDLLSSCAQSTRRDAKSWTRWSIPLESLTTSLRTRIIFLPRTY